MNWRPLATAFGFVLATACSAAEAPAPTTESALAEQTTSDTATLRARSVETLDGSRAFSVADCTNVPGGLQMDCTSALEKRFGTPALHEILVGQDTRSFHCQVLHVETVTRRDAMNAATGLGFYYRGYGGHGRFVPKALLKKTGEATLKDGSSADVHEFIGLTACWLGSASSSGQARYEFKAYATFDSGADRYRNWEQGENHAVTAQISNWDRSSELLH